MEPRITTFTGKFINPLDLQLDDIDIRDIAHALALCNRFAGHSKRPISVAQHSVFVSKLCVNGYPTWRPGALQGLLHDASDAYIGDITRWVKHSPEMSAFRSIEKKIQEQIFLKFHCPLEMLSSVRTADLLMLRFEAEQAFGRTTWSRHNKNMPEEFHPLATPTEIRKIGDWTPWSWRRSEEAFLDRFVELSDES